MRRGLSDMSSSGQVRNLRSGSRTAQVMAKYAGGMDSCSEFNETDICCNVSDRHDDGSSGESDVMDEECHATDEDSALEESSASDTSSSHSISEELEDDDDDEDSGLEGRPTTHGQARGYETSADTPSGSPSVGRPIRTLFNTYEVNIKKEELGTKEHPLDLRQNFQLQQILGLTDTHFVFRTVFPYTQKQLPGLRKRDLKALNEFQEDWFSEEDDFLNDSIRARIRARFNDYCRDLKERTWEGQHWSFHDSNYIARGIEASDSELNPESCPSEASSDSEQSSYKSEASPDVSEDSSGAVSEEWDVSTLPAWPVSPMLAGQGLSSYLASNPNNAELVPGPVRHLHVHAGSKGRHRSNQSASTSGTDQSTASYPTIATLMPSTSTSEERQEEDDSSSSEATARNSQQPKRGRHARQNPYARESDVSSPRSTMSSQSSYDSDYRDTTGDSGLSSSDSDNDSDTTEAASPPTPASAPNPRHCANRTPRPPPATASTPANTTARNATKAQRAPNPQPKPDDHAPSQPKIPKPAPSRNTAALNAILAPYAPRVAAGVLRLTSREARQVADTVAARVPAMRAAGWVDLGPLVQDVLGADVEYTGDVQRVSPVRGRTRRQAREGRS